MRMLSSALRRYVGHCALDDLEECLLYAFGLIGFVRVMLVLATWIDDLTIESQPLSYRDYAERPGAHAKAGERSRI